MHPAVRNAVRLITLCALFAVGLVSASPALAAGNPDVHLNASAGSPLYGESGSVSTTASLPSGEIKGYNLSFRVVLPAGISYGGGSAISPRVINNAPASGQTTLIFSNVSDLVANSSQALDFKVNHDPNLYEVGDDYGITYGAFVNSNPRFVPSFDAQGQPDPSSYTGSADATTTSTISAIKLSKSEPSREGEILRGVHDHQTIYTLKLTNNAINPTDSTTIDDYLPADLEFLGCQGDPDNTTDAPSNPGSADEYPGSGPIDIAFVDDCHAPKLVETVFTDPDGSGPMPEAVYTHVQWETGDLDPSQVLTYRYRAAVPLSENTLDWNGSADGKGDAPDPATNAQAANLDNNSGPETTDEQKITNYALAAGDYQGSNGVKPVTSDDSITRTAEDLLVYKSASSATIGQGDTTSWELRFRTGEYRYSNDIRVTDTLPNGYCPLGPVNYTTGNDPSDSECAPTGANPDVPYSKVTENADGTFTIVWNPDALAKLTHTTVNDEFTINFPTRTRKNYQANFLPTTPVLAKDSASNKVDLTGNAFSRCTSPGTPDCSTDGPIIWSNGQQPEAVVDASSSGQSAPPVVLHKEVAESGTDCQAATYVTTIPTYQPGDQVCWRVTIDFPSKVDTKELKVTDFLPRNATYVSGSYQDTSANTTSNTIDTGLSGSGILNWDIDGSYVPVGNQKFQVVFSTKINPPGVMPPVDIEGNLAKFAIANTPGQAFPLRDQADFKTVPPQETISKGVKQVNSGTVHSPPVDGLTVRGGDSVTYQVDVKSTGDTKDVQVWDQLPSQYDCSMLSAISDGGNCVDGGSGVDRIKWLIPSIDDGATQSLTYKVLIPGTFGPENTYVNTAGVRQYEADTNVNDRYVYTPDHNIDPDNPRSPNIGRVDDQSNVKTPNVGMSKTRTTSFNETPGNSDSQATIGETINYTVKATLPSGTTFGTDAKITDTPDSASTQPIVGTPTATLNGAPLPAGWSISTTGQTVTVNIPDNYVVPLSGNTVVAILLSTKVTDVSDNKIGVNRYNQANITWKDGKVRNRKSQNVATRIVEPQIAQGKTNDIDPNEALPGDTVTYTLITANSSNSYVSIAHNTVIRDVVPAGVTLVDGGGAPLADGAAVPGTGGAIWNATTRTITSSPVDIDPNSHVTWTYKATIDIPAVAGSKFKNVADAMTESMGSGHPGQRTAESPSHDGYIGSANSIVKVGGSSVTKSVDPAWVTIGTPMTFTATLTIPKNLTLYNLTAADVLPDSVDFDNYLSASCISGCSAADPAPAIQNYNPDVTSSVTDIGWDLGKVNPGSVDRVIQFKYTAHVRDTYRGSGAQVLAGQNVVNRIHGESNLTSKYSFDANNLRLPNSYDRVSPDAATTTPVREPNLKLDKKVKTTPAGSFVDGPVESQPGDPLTYSIEVRNTGTSAAYDVTVNDMPDADLTNVALAQGAAYNTKDWSSGSRSMKWQIPGPIAPGGSVTLTYMANSLGSASLHTGATAINTAGSTYYGVAGSERTKPWDYRDYKSNDDTVKVLFEFPEIHVDKTTTAPGFPDIADANVEQSFGWRIVVKNNADVAAALDTVVHDTLPPDWTYDSGSTSISGATTAEPSVVTDSAGDKLTWNFAGQTIAPHGSFTITFTATPGLDARANPPVQTNDSDAVARDSSGSDHNADGPYTDGDDAKAKLKFPIADLDIDKSAPAEVNSHQQFDYTMKVHNKGPDPATHVVINDPLPAGLTFVSSADCSPVAVCNIGNLASGASKTVVIRVETNYALAGTTLVNTAVVTGKEWEPTPGDNTDTVKTHVTSEANVKITKTAAPTNARPGDVVTYTLKAKNIGNAIADNVVITDSMPVGLTFVSADSPCVEATGTVTCEIGSLDPGQVRTYTVKATVDPWGNADPTQDHLLDVQKNVAQIDLEAGQTRTVSVTCPTGYFASDGSVRVDHIDQGTGDWTSPEVLESRASSPGTWQATVKNTATGRAQAKVFVVCISKTTVDGNHSHDLIVSDPITVSHAALAGQNEAILPCGPGQTAIQPGFDSDGPGDLLYSEPEGNGWKFVFDLKAPANVTYSIRCMSRQVSVVDGHTHDLKLDHIQTEVTIPPGTVNEAQLTCADGSKGIVADQDLDYGLIPLGNDPRPVTRAFKIYNPTDQPLKARISLLCLGNRTGGEHAPPKTLINTAMISTTSFESQTGNNSSSATVIAEDTDNYDPVPDPDPVKPVVNNPVAGKIAGFSVHGKTLKVKVRCAGICKGKARLKLARRFRAGGKKFRKGTLLARKHYRLKRGRHLVRLKLTHKGRKLLRRLKRTHKGQRVPRSKKKAGAVLRISGGASKFVRIGR